MHIGIRNIAIDGYQMVSKSHVEHMHTYDQTADPSKFFIVPNGVDLARYANPPERQPYRVIHSSSPDRGLHHLLRIWPKIKKAVPQAELHIYYEINRWLDLIESLDKEKRTTITTIRAGEVRDGLKATEGMDVTCHGAVNQWDLAQEQMKSSLMIYPCDPVAYTEGFSISCLESMAAGTPVITSDADALPELWGDCTTMLPLPVEDADWIDASVRLLTKKKPWLAASRLGREVAANYQWKDITRDYAEILDRKFYAKVLKEKLTPISPMEFMVSAMGR
ncbi:MAG: D-inositol-3-phosphate glycosyltransferase [Nitrosomonadaceae bacterium]|nr:D-inositol-3-phosphate glycosyltransferase [Nitrosomonadaceae bacterium]